MSKINVNRRQFLIQAGAMSLMLYLNPTVVWATPTFKQNPFNLGVASGEPSSDGFVIWTRVIPKPLQIDGGMPNKSVEVQWEIASDPEFKSIIQSGVEIAHPDLAHSVHVEVEKLDSSSSYWYRFKLADYVSTVGKTKTLPTATQHLNAVTLAVVGCQNYEAGYFTAYDYLSKESGIDAVYHYGDYIYEGGIGHGSSRGYDDLRVSVAERRHINEEPFNLKDYRLRYAQYKTDPHLQKAHAVFPFIITIDDHEIVNNWAGLHDANGMPEAEFIKRRAAAFQAWYEHIPVRRSQQPKDHNLLTHRSFDFGNLLRLSVLDTRQHRDNRLCTVAQKKEGITWCRKESTETETMLGVEQEKWLEQQMQHNKRWNVLAQQVMLMPYDRQKKRDGKVSISGKDSWDGYPIARKKFIQSLKKYPQHNNIILTGDIHQYFVGVLPENPLDFSSKALATELLTTSISSSGNGIKIRPGQEYLLERNPHMQYINDQRGYQLVTFNQNQCITELKIIDQVEKPGGIMTTAAKFVIDVGNPIPKRLNV